jgi:Flp pilus assembly protein TadG
MMRKPAMKLVEMIRRFRDDRRGNVLMIFAFSVIPLIFAAGMVIDYSRAARLQTKMNAIADAAALYAVSEPMLKVSSTTAKSKAMGFFNAQATGLNGLIYSGDVSVVVTDTSPAALERNVTVSYQAQSFNIFGKILSRRTIEIGGTAIANAKTAPNIDFYMLLDTSPSMALPATSLGLTQLSKATKGCAFACHQTSTTSTDPGNTRQVNGQYVDYYYVAKNDLGLVLRSDLVTEAVEDLADVAKTAAQQNNAVYRMAIGSFDWDYHSIQDAPTTMDIAKGMVGQAQNLVVCRNNQRVCGKSDGDMHTNFTKALSGMDSRLPVAPGNGTNISGDTPQAIMFLITDGMRDENDGARKLGPMPTVTCDKIKNRGIKIAVLYTEYLWESASDSWSISNVRTPYLDSPEKISPPLLSCASPGLYYRVTTDSDISAALGNLFQRAVQSAHLTG